MSIEKNRHAAPPYPLCVCPSLSCFSQDPGRRRRAYRGCHVGPGHIQVCRSLSPPFGTRTGTVYTPVLLYGHSSKHSACICVSGVLEHWEKSVPVGSSKQGATWHVSAAAGHIDHALEKSSALRSQLWECPWRLCPQERRGRRRLACCFGVVFAADQVATAAPSRQ